MPAAGPRHRPDRPGSAALRTPAGPRQAADDLRSADQCYADRANLSSARRAAALWSADVAKDAGNFEAAWKLARVDYWLGGHAEDSQRRRFLEQGIEAARKAIAVQPNRPEGHFWLAANMGSLAESFGLRQGLKYRKPIKESLETVLRLDPEYQQGSADRGLGRWYYKVPGLFGGGDTQAEAHLRASLRYNPNSTVTHFFLAELYADNGRRDEARAELQKVVDAPFDADWAPEDREYKEKARRMLARLR